MLIAGAVITATGGPRAAVRNRARPTPATIVLNTVTMVVFIAAALNLFSLFVTGPGAGIVDPGAGLHVLAGGGLVGVIGSLVADTRNSQRTRPQAATR